MMFGNPQVRNALVKITHHYNHGEGLSSSYDYFTPWPYGDARTEERRKYWGRVIQENCDADKVDVTLIHFPPAEEGEGYDDDQ